MPGLASHSLLSVTKLCNAGCTVEFTMIGCNITYRGRKIVCGKKCTATGLWMIPITDKPNAIQPTINQTSPTAHNYDTINSAKEFATNTIQTSTMEELAKYYHQCLLSPPKLTLLQSINNQPLRTFPGLTYGLISKHLPPSTATDKGHMKRRKQNIRSTRSNKTDIQHAKFEVMDMHPPQQMCAALDMFCFAALADANEGTMYTDLTGKFPVRSYKNNQYVFVAYFYSLNAIIVWPMPNRADNAMVATFKDIIEHLKSCGHQPQLNVMDNECSKAVKTYINSENINIQLVEPHDHHVNAAERAIQTFKHHFIAGLATVDIDFPIQLWDEFLPQAQMTLNMLRTSRQNPNKTAYEELHGQFDFNKTPIAPLGTRALIYDDPDSRTSWAPRGIDAFYISPALLHYRCLRFFNPESRSFRTSGSYKLYPTHCTNPSISQADLTLQAANELCKTLQMSHAQKMMLSTQQKLQHTKALNELTDIITNSTPPRVVPNVTPPLEPVGPPRVNAPSTSVNPTSPNNIYKTKLVHQRKTRSNTPIPTIIEEIEPPNNTTNRSNNQPKVTINTPTTLPRRSP